MIERKTTKLSMQELLDRQKRYFDDIRTFAYTVISSAEYRTKNQFAKVEHVEEQRLKDLNENIYVRYFQYNDYRERHFNELRSLDFTLYELQIDRIRNKTNTCWGSLPKGLRSDYLDLFSEIDYHLIIFLQAIPLDQNSIRSQSLKPVDLGWLFAVIKNNDSPLTAKARLEDLLRQYGIPDTEANYKKAADGAGNAAKKLRETRKSKLRVRTKILSLLPLLKEEHNDLVAVYDWQKLEIRK